MKIKFILCVLLLSFSQLFADSMTEGFVRKTLKNGLEVCVIQNHLVPLVTLEICTRNGSFTEPPDYNGLSHLYEHMFFKANDVLPSQEAYLKRVHELGISFNGSTHTEFVNYFFTLPATNFDPGMKFMADAIETPKFDEEELKKERKVVLGEFDRDQSQPLFALEEGMDSVVWAGNISRKTPLGVRPTIDAATQDQMHTIQHRYYIPNNSLLIIAGDVKPEEAFAEAEKYLDSWKPGPDPFKEYPIPAIQPLDKKQLIIRPSSIPPQLAFAQQQWHGPSVGTDDKATFAADVFSYILNQSTSRFYKTMVESGLTMGIEVGYEQQHYVGPIAASMQMQPENLVAAIDTLHSEINHWDDDNYFTDEELETAKHILKVQHLYEAENTSNFVHDVSFFWASCGDKYMDDYLDGIEHITRQDIKNYVDNYIKGKNYVLGVGMAEENIKKITLNPAEVLQ